MDQNNPLDEAYIKSLIDKKEETQLVDFKETFVKDEKHWVDISKDCISFANNKGGYLLFGVNDKGLVLGLEDETLEILTNSDEVQKKIESKTGEFITINTRSMMIGKRNIAVWVIAQSDELLIMGKDGRYKYPSGDVKHSYYKGQIWIRRNSGNSLLTTRRLSTLLNKAMRVHTQDVLSKLKAINTGASVLGSRNGIPVRLTTDSRAPAMKGVSFTTTPSTILEKIAASVAMYNVNKSNKIHPDLLGEARLSRLLHPELNYQLALHSIYACFPTLYWIHELGKDRWPDLFQEAASDSDRMEAQFYALRLSSLGGRSCFNKVKKIVDGRRGKKSKTVFREDPRHLFTYTTRKSEIPSTSRGMTSLHLKLLDELSSKWNDPIFNNKMIYVEFSIYFTKLGKV